jgi:virginiamycin B lyase
MTPMPCGSATGEQKAILRFDPKTERFESFPLPDSYANVRQLAGRKGEAWGAESAADKLFMAKSE